jgi:hypothetical protein
MYRDSTGRIIDRLGHYGPEFGHDLTWDRERALIHCHGRWMPSSQFTTLDGSAHAGETAGRRDVIGVLAAACPAANELPCSSSPSMEHTPVVVMSHCTFTLSSFFWYSSIILFNYIEMTY